MEERPLLDQEEFGDVVEERLEQLGGIEELSREGMEIRFRWHGRAVVSELEHFYNAYRRSPAQLESILQSLEAAVRSFAPDRGQELWDELEDRIYPMIKPATMLLEVAERNLPQLVYRPFLADLIICYVIDEPESVAYINEEHLKTWGVLETTIYTKAVDNLRTKTLKPGMAQVVGEGNQMLFIYSTSDGYDASRILLTDVLNEWAALLPGNLVLGIPNRDFLIGFSDANPEILQRIAMQIAQDAYKLDYGLSDQLWTVKQGQILIYEYDWSSSERKN
ncbi:DUF1444 family protein [Herpetosiphon geysericola]|uniref:DUF1444 family protein n=1 Tax=Herpetosiphon geysericola TaxID=70996 RepID=A0A0P6Y4I2_9CHLR|nr:DUF1444 family protein [Herpetosiphon geysericola]KPL86809.1 hypothetical protein SE18_12700 [Herpetosiphon geysericola]